VPLFVFKFSPDSYQEQHAVVEADSAAEALELLSDDLSRQGAMRSRPSFNGANGLHSFYHNAEALDPTPIKVTGHVAYTHGVDG